MHRSPGAERRGDKPGRTNTLTIQARQGRARRSNLLPSRRRGVGPGIRLSRGSRAVRKAAASRRRTRRRRNGSPMRWRLRPASCVKPAAARAMRIDLDRKADFLFLLCPHRRRQLKRRKSRQSRRSRRGAVSGSQQRPKNLWSGKSASHRRTQGWAHSRRA